MTNSAATRLALSSLLPALLAGCNTAPPASPSVAVQHYPTVQTESANPGSPRRRSRRARPAANAQPGDFDFYLLTLSWSPEFCATHSGSPECSAHLGFVVHGLWPQNDDGTYPENVAPMHPAPQTPAVHQSLPTASLVEHEWSTHGTCSGLAPDAYFAEIATAFHQLRIPTAFTGNNQPPTLTPAAIIDDFTTANPGLTRSSVAISCGRNYLTAVELCLSKSLQPQACPNVHTCGATVVKITSR